MDAIVAVCGSLAGDKQRGSAKRGKIGEKKESRLTKSDWPKGGFARVSQSRSRRRPSAATGRVLGGVDAKQGRRHLPDILCLCALFFFSGRSKERDERSGSNKDRNEKYFKKMSCCKKCARVKNVDRLFASLPSARFFPAFSESLWIWRSKKKKRNPDKGIEEKRKRHGLGGDRPSWGACKHRVDVIFVRKQRARKKKGARKEGPEKKKGEGVFMGRCDPRRREPRDPRRRRWQ